MDQRRADQPGHERRIFDGVPEPPTAPAQFVVRPPRPQGDTQAQESPCGQSPGARPARPGRIEPAVEQGGNGKRSEEHTSELQSIMRISYAVFCLKKKKQKIHIYMTNYKHQNTNITITNTITNLRL